MKIVIICPSWPPKACGIGDYTFKLAGEFLRMGQEVKLITSGGKDAGLNKNGLDEDKKIAVTPVINSWGAKSLPELLKIIKYDKPRIVHIQYQSNLYECKQAINFLPLLLRLFTKSKIVVTLHELQHPRFLPFTDLFSKFNIFLMVFFSHRIIVTSSMQLARIPQDFGLKAKTAVIPVGSNIDIFPITQKKKIEFRKSLGVADDEILLLNFGLIRPGKGLEVLFMALKRVLQDGYRVKLCLLGARPSNYWDEYRQGLFDLAKELGISENLIDRGYLEEEQASHLLSCADMLILPYSEGASTKRGPLAAGVLHNLAVITTKSEHTRPYFKHEENVFFVNPEDERTLKEAIIRVAGDKELSGKLKNNISALKKYFIWENIAVLHSKIYKRLLAQKILFITMGFPPDIGGVQTLMYEACNSLRQSLPVVLTAQQIDSKGFDKKQKFKIYRFLKSKKGFLRLIRFAVYSLFLAYNEKPGFVFCNNLLHDAFCGFLIKKIRGTPFSIYVHDMHDLMHLIKKGRWGRLLINLNIKSADYVFTNSNFTKSLLGKFLITQKIIVLPPAVDTERYHPLQDASFIVSKYKLQNKKVLLSVCRLSEHKGIDTVLEAINLLKKDFRDIIYLVVGEGEDRLRIEKLINGYNLGDQVIMAGAVREEGQLPQYYAAAQIFLMPSRETKEGFVFEGFGISFLEAAASCLPCIGGRIGGVSEAIVDGVTGILVNPLDINETVAALRRLLNDYTLRNKMGIAARERVMSEFNCDSFAKRLEGLIWGLN